MPVDNIFANFQPTFIQAPLSFILSPLELTSLMSSRLCHDLISPVGAINNAMELFEEGLGDEDVLKLMQMSAVNASARLQFSRLAYGTAGSTGDFVNPAETEKLVRNFLGDDKIMMHWQTNTDSLPKEMAKFLLNLVVLAAASIPRGGEIEVFIAAEQYRPHFCLRTKGSVCRLPPPFIALYQGVMQKEEVTAHNIQFYWMLLLSAQTNSPLDIAENEGVLYFVTR